MIVEFERVQEDLTEFNLFHIAHSRNIQSQILISQLVGGLFLVVAPLFVSYSLTQAISIIVYAISFGGGILFFVGYPYFYKAIATWQAKKLLNEGNNKSMLGHHVVSLSSEGIFYKMEESESKLSWSSVDKVVQNNKYIFIYIGALNALVIPKAAFSTSEDQKQFLDFVHANVNKKPT